jgi:hypothetical protein
MRCPALWFLTVLLVTLSGAPALAAETVDLEMATKVKAAYLFQFTLFVRWPEGSFPDEQAPIVIGLLGADPFGRMLDATVADEKVRGRSIEVRRLGQDDGAYESVRGCHVLFVSDMTEPRLDAMLTAWRDSSVLTVSDLDGFAARGGVVELALEKGRIVFRVNRVAAERAGLKLSARLLSLADIVEPRAEE